MGRTEALQGLRMVMFLNVLNRWELAELNQAEAAEVRQGDFGEPGRSGAPPFLWRQGVGQFRAEEL